MKKLYFLNEDADHCYSEDYFQDEMKTNGLTEITVIEAEKSRSKEYIYCASVGECGESSECGNKCEEYEPRNGKNGGCRHRRAMYEHGDEAIIKLK